MALAKSKKRLLSYVAILGGLAVLSLTLFTVSQFESAKHQASKRTLNTCQKKLRDLTDAYRTEKSIPQTEEVNMEAFITDESSAYSKAGEYWYYNVQYFKQETAKNAALYKGTAIPAYLLSMSTLVAFGLILKHAEKAKEKEDEEAVLQR